MIKYIFFVVCCSIGIVGGSLQAMVPKPDRLAQLLLSKGIDPELLSRATTDRQWLFRAIIDDNVSALQKVIDNGVDVNAPFVSEEIVGMTSFQKIQFISCTPLGKAASLGKKKIVRVLLGLPNIDLNVKGCLLLNGTPLSFAVTYGLVFGDFDVATMLVNDRRTNLNERDSQENTVLDILNNSLEKPGVPELRSLLIQYGARSTGKVTRFWRTIKDMLS